MREKIKAIFLQSNHQFISGEELSKQLHISRTAVWKQIEELKKEGYRFEAVRKKGYRLLNQPDDIHPDQIHPGLNTKWLGKKIVFLKETISTQQNAHDLAKNGAEHGTVVLTDQQTKGRGRLGRTWFSEKGKGIWMSLILRPTFTYQQAPTITLITSLALVESLNQLYGIEAQIKWPNDIYINGRKSAGILTEMHGEQDRIHYLIIGIGINTHHMNYPQDIENKAISIAEVIDKEPKRAALIQRFLEKFEEEYGAFETLGFDPFYERYNRQLYGKGKTIVVSQLNGQDKGYIEGIDRNGYLMIKKGDGQIKKVTSGDILFIE